MRESPPASAGRTGWLFVGAAWLLLSACSDAESPFSPEGPQAGSPQDGAGYHLAREACVDTFKLVLGQEWQRYRSSLVACNGAAECTAAEVGLHDAILEEIRRDYERCRRGR